MSTTQAISLTLSHSGEIVEAEIVTLRAKHVEDYELLWQDLLREFVEEDKYWSWALKERRAENHANYEGYAVEYDSLTQGMMILETQNRRSWLVPGQPLVYVEALTTAPWNRPSIHNPPELRGVGTALLMFSRQRSLELGYRGRVGLESLPGSEQFYENRSMVRCELDPEDIIDPEEKLTYFEFRAYRQRRPDEPEDYEYV